MIYQTEPSNCKKEWRDISSPKRLDTYFCKTHGKAFSYKESCPLMTHPNISHGTDPAKKENPISEQGVEQGVSITNMDVSVTPNKLQNEVLSASKVSHAFRFTIILRNPPNWSDRDKICKSKGLNVELRAGIGRVFMTAFKGHKIWLSDRSIVVYFPEWRKYYVDEARTGLNFAIADLKVFLDELAVLCDSNFLIDDTYRFKVGGQHHALIYNSLAKMYNRDKKKLNVYDKGGELWLVIDNSRRESIRMDDVETLKPETAVRDMDDVVAKHFNDLRDNDSYIPSEVKDKLDNTEKDIRASMDLMMGIKDNLVEQNKAILLEIENKKLHQEVLVEMKDTMKEMRDEMKYKSQTSDSNIIGYNLPTLSKYSSDVDIIRAKRDFKLSLTRRLKDNLGC